MKTVKLKGSVITNDYKRAYDYYGYDSIAPSDIDNALAEANGDDVIFEINSNGGVCTSAYEIYNAIKSYTGKTTAHITTACSAATVIACACDEVLIGDSGIFMIHNAQSIAIGDYRDMDKESSALNAFDDSIINVYMLKTGKCREDIKSLMDNDTYMSPQQAVELGFCDGYIHGSIEDRCKTKNTVNDIVSKIVASSTRMMIPSDKLQDFYNFIDYEEAKPTKSDNNDNDENENKKSEPTQNASVATVNEIKKEVINMTLNEVLAQNPEIKAEIDTLVSNAREEGVSAERERMQSLDAIANSVTPEALNKAKYVEITNGKDLAFSALVNGETIAKNYIENAVTDSDEAGVNEVGIGAGEDETTDESDEMSSYINKMRG